MISIFSVVLKTTVVLGVACLAAFLLRRRSASIRYALWTSVLTAILILPAQTLMTPHWKVAVGPVLAAPAATAEDTAQVTSVVVEASGPVSQLSIVWMLWAAGAIAMLLRLAIGHCRVRSLFAKGAEVRDAHWLAVAARTATELGLRRSVTLKRSAATDVPLSYGVFQPIVLLPADSEDWTQDRRRIVLMHEMIHARRLDSLWGFVAQMALAAHWFHPLAWVAVKQFRKEQEWSCDDAVVTAGTANTVYASHLVDVARSIALPEPALGMAAGFDLEGRVRALLDSNRNRKSASRGLCIAMLTTAAIVTCPLGLVRAKSETRAEQPHAASTMGEPTAPLVVASPVVDVVEAAAPADDPAPMEAPSGDLRGSVLDPTGAVVPNAKLTLKGVNGIFEQVAISSSAGEYSIPNIPVGDYILRAQSMGFATYQKALSIIEGATASLNPQLTIGETQSEVVITAERPQANPSERRTPQRIRVGGNVQAPNLISKVNPVYPPEARAEGIEGTVLLHAVVSKEGRLLNVVVLNNGGDKRLAAAAVEAVQVWQYLPTRLNGEPVEVVTTIAIAFRLN